MSKSIKGMSSEGRAAIDRIAVREGKSASAVQKELSSMIRRFCTGGAERRVVV